MGLLTYVNIEDGQDATANVLNQRFGKIADILNGNIDSSNLANQAVTAPKLADGSVTTAKLAINRYIDDNGWTVTDFGGTKTYQRVVVVDGSDYDGNGLPGSQGFLIAGNGSRRDITTIPLPVGRSITTINVTESYFGQYSGHLVVSGELRNVSGVDQIMIAGGNIWPNQLSFKGKIFVQVTDLL